jgi:hypothetical protein
MKKLATLSALIMGAALLSVAPFSLRLSPERIVSLSLDTAAAAKIGATGPRGPVKVDRPVGHCGWVRGVWVCR